MKKIGIITFHRALNYGAVLQAYALCESLKKLDSNIVVEIIDYRNDNIEKGRKLKERLLPFSIKNVLRTFLLVKKVKKFNIFINGNLSLSKKIYSKDNFIELSRDYDKIIVGSDQVWNFNITGNDKNYLLDSLTCSKYSYAASLGLNYLDNETLEVFKKLLCDFKMISVREEEAKEILRKISSKIIVTLDPTLLLTANDWKNIVDYKKNDKYILVYNIKKPDYLLDIAKKVSNETNYKVVFIPNGIFPKFGKLEFPSISRFVGLFKNAEYVLTNSFHGTVFSTIFHKKMLIELNSKGTGNDRIVTLTKMCGLENRVFAGEYNIIYEDINWKNVDKLIQERRIESINYLKDVVMQEDNNEK